MRYFIFMFMLLFYVNAAATSLHNDNDIGPLLLNEAQTKVSLRLGSEVSQNWRRTIVNGSAIETLIQAVDSIAKKTKDKDLQASLRVLKAHWAVMKKKANELQKKCDTFNNKVRSVDLKKSIINAFHCTIRPKK